MRLKEKVAIVTGGSQGIGKAICEAFAREGAKVAVVNRTAEKGEAVAGAINAGGGAAKAFPCDVSKKSGVDAMVESVVGEYGTVDILVANAGIMINKKVEEYSEDEWDRIIDINLKGNFLLSQALIGVGAVVDDHHITLQPRVRLDVGIGKGRPKKLFGERVVRKGHL